jgi:hypothetical protein
MSSSALDGHRSRRCDSGGELLAAAELVMLPPWMASRAAREYEGNI